MEQQEIQYYYELILTIIDYLIALALILVGHKRHWRWLIVDQEIEKKILSYSVFRWRLFNLHLHFFRKMKHYFLGSLC